MKFLALRYTVAGKPQLMVDTLQPENVTERYSWMRIHVPENNPHLVQEELPDSETAETLRPEAPDPFATEALDLVGRQAIPQCSWTVCGLPATVRVHADGITGNFCDEHGEELSRVDCLAEVTPLRDMRAQLPTLPETLVERDRRANAGILRKGEG